MAPTDDPIRADVERRLRAAVDLALAGPLGTVRTIDACVRRRVESARVVVDTPLALLRSLFDLVAAPAERDVPAASSGRDVIDVIDVDDVVDVVDGGAAPTVDDQLASEGGPPADLPIDEYESLAASQVVARLGGLSPAELRRIRRFEAGRRGRRTVLGKIDQLLAEA